MNNYAKRVQNYCLTPVCDGTLTKDEIFIWSLPSKNLMQIFFALLCIYAGAVSYNHTYFVISVVQVPLKCDCLSVLVVFDISKCKYNLFFSGIFKYWLFFSCRHKLQILNVNIFNNKFCQIRLNDISYIVHTFSWRQPHIMLVAGTPVYCESHITPGFSIF